VDLERLLAARGRAIAPRALRSSRRWKLAAAAVLLVGVSAGVGRSAGRWEAANVRASLAVELAESHEETLAEVSRALGRSCIDLLDRQQEGIKDVAVLVRKEYRPRLARLEAEVKGLRAITLEVMGSGSLAFGVGSREPRHGVVEER